MRSKVSALRAEQGDPGGRDRARSLHRFAVERLERSRVRLILVGGPPGSGKSTLAEGLGRALGARVLRSDVVRKRRARIPAGVGAGAPWQEGIYHPDETAHVYDDLLAEAGPMLAQGETVVLDASWSSAAARRAARHTGIERAADLVELRCELPRTWRTPGWRSAGARAATRRTPDPRSPTPCAPSADPWPEASRVEHASPPDAVLGAALDLVPGARQRDEAGCG